MVQQGRDIKRLEARVGTVLKGKWWLDRLIGVGEIVFENDQGQAYEGVWTCVGDPSTVAETVNQAIGRYGR